MHNGSYFILFIVIPLVLIKLVSSPNWALQYKRSSSSFLESNNNTRFRMEFIKTGSLCFGTTPFLYKGSLSRTLDLIKLNRGPSLLLITITLYLKSMSPFFLSCFRSQFKRLRICCSTESNRLNCHSKWLENDMSLNILGTPKGPCAHLLVLSLQVPI